jgi:hypothetical protein
MWFFKLVPSVLVVCSPIPLVVFFVQLCPSSAIKQKGTVEKKHDKGYRWAHHQNWEHQLKNPVLWFPSRRCCIIRMTIYKLTWTRGVAALLTCSVFFCYLCHFFCIFSKLQRVNKLLCNPLIFLYQSSMTKIWLQTKFHIFMTFGIYLTFLLDRHLNHRKIVSNSEKGQLYTK